LEGTDLARMPFWSPDSRSIAFFGDGKLKVISATGGPATVWCGETGLGRGGTWSRDGVILFADENRTLRRVSASGGPCTPVKLGGEDLEAETPEFLPDGNHFLFVGRFPGVSLTGLYLADLNGMKPRKILNDDSSAIYSPPVAATGLAHLLFLRGSNLMAQPFDPSKLEPVGDPFAVAAQASVTANAPQVGASVAPNGTLAYIVNRTRQVQLTWFDRSGTELAKALGVRLVPRWPASHLHRSRSKNARRHLVFAGPREARQQARSTSRNQCDRKPGAAVSRRALAGLFCE